MSLPFLGKEFVFQQPDGTSLKVRGWGDQHSAVFETPDGFPVVEDPATGFYHYANVTADGADLETTGVRAGSIDPAAIALTSRARVSREAVRGRAALGLGLPRSKTRWESRREQARLGAITAALEPGIALAPPQRQTVGDYVGLCLLVQFPDVPGTIPLQEVQQFCNQQGYAGFGNKGSVRDYFFDNSGGKLRYTNIVTPYYTAKHKRTYYTNPGIPQPQRTWTIIKEALAHWRAQGFNFGQLTADSGGYVYAVNVFYAGPCVNNWAKGLWPHSYHLQTPYKLAAGKNAYDYQITNMGAELTLGTFCHENGHMICDFPDLYDYGYESGGVGVYCLMCAGPNADEKNPVQVGAYLKHQAGWAHSVKKLTPGTSAAISAGQNDFFLLERNSVEYFIIENRQQAGRDAALPDSGLAIWHIDELGSNNSEQMTPAQHYECSLEQADNAFNLEHNDNNGDAGDLFHAGTKTSFSNQTHPDSKWWDGTPSGLNIANISAAGPNMTFDVA